MAMLLIGIFLMTSANALQQVEVQQKRMWRPQQQSSNGHTSAFINGNGGILVNQGQTKADPVRQVQGEDAHGELMQVTHQADPVPQVYGEDVHGELMQVTHQADPVAIQPEPSTRTRQISAGDASVSQPQPIFAEGVNQGCDFTASDSIWARYMKAPKRGVLRFNGEKRGQGVGNVLGGLATAVILATVSGRELAIEYSPGGILLSDVVPANKVGPMWNKARAGGKCSATADNFNFGASTQPQQIIQMAMDVTSNPVLCYNGNFGRGNLLGLLTNQSKSSDTLSIGCALNFVFDTTSFKNELVPGAFNLAGHLRLGDGHMTGGGDGADTGRGVLGNPDWGLHDINIVGPKFVECMQGVARSLWTLYKDRGCTITVLSDSSKVKATISSLANQKPCNVQVTHGIAKHSVHRFSEADAKSMFTDLFTLGSANATMLTSSGFGIVGASMGLSAHHLSYKFEDFLKGHHEQQVAGDKQATFEDFCYSKAVEGATKLHSESLAEYSELVFNGML